MSCILSQLNILCTNLVKSHYTENNNSLVIHHSHVTAILVFSEYWISSKRSVPYTKTFSTLSGVRTVFWILPQIDILCTSAVKRCYAKWQFTVQVSPVFPCNGVHGSKKNMPPGSSDLNLVIHYSGELCNKNCIVKISRALIIWSASCYTATRNRRGARLTAKKSNEGV